MKKSTLITTIAMIVVVVVALSTATYAWFTSGTATQVEDSMTTTAASGWYLYGGTASANPSATNYQASRTITYSQNAEIDMHLMNSGLYSPAAALAGTLTTATNNGTLALTSSYTDTQFFAASQEGFGILDTATVTKAVAFNHKEGLANGTESNTTYDNVNAIRIVNGTGAVKDLHLTILVYISGDVTTQAELAGMGFTTYIVTSDASNNTFTTGYNYASSFGSAGAVDDTATRSTTAVSGNITRPGSWTSLAADSYFGPNKPVSATLSADKEYYIMDVVLKSNMAAGSALNIAFYAWFDGWALDTTAQGGSIDICYAFGDTAATVTTWTA